MRLPIIGGAVNASHALLTANKTSRLMRHFQKQWLQMHETLTMHEQMAMNRSIDLIEGMDAPNSPGFPVFGESSQPVPLNASALCSP